MNTKTGRYGAGASNELLQYNIIVIGASMGGFNALRLLISELPANLPAAVFVVLHIPTDHKSYLSELLGRNAKLSVVTAKDLELIEFGRVYVAAPDFHLRMNDRQIQLDRGPKHNFHRPAVDTLFFSAAQAFGPRVIGVILTGALDDGTAGLMEIKKNGGMAIVQDPADAVNPSMPASALDRVPVDYCVPLAEMAGLLTGFAGQRIDFSILKKNKRNSQITKKSQAA